MAWYRKKCAGCGRSFETRPNGPTEGHRVTGPQVAVGVSACSLRCALVAEHKSELERRAAR